ncbi:hypothetical protein R4036_004583 [Salmonella enterica]|nr:hypothetical protein [Salmonella enterica]
MKHKQEITDFMKLIKTSNDKVKHITESLKHTASKGDVIAAKVSKQRLAK